MAIGLNPEQQRAVLHREGPLLVLAGAGTGKTRVVTERIARLLATGVAPENILAVTFTNKAAAEMRERLAGLVGRRFDLAPMVMATFHSLCVRLIRRDPERLGYRAGFAICDRGEQLSILRQASRNVTGAAKLSPEDLLEAVGRHKNVGRAPRTVLRDAVEPAELTTAHVYRKYQSALKARNSLDFDDLLGLAVELLRGHPDVLAHWRERFHFILVDEFQDTNSVQLELLDLLAQPRRNLCVVGDDDQSIYGWRGAEARNILDFHHRYRGAVVVTLEQNYRSVNAVLRVANAVIGHNRERRPKTLRSDLGDGDSVRVVDCPDQEEEAHWLADDVRDRLNQGRPPSAMAVLLRVNAQARRLEEALRERRIPYVVIGGQSYYERKEVRDLLAYLALVSNPDDDNAFRRIVNTPPRGLGEKTLEAMEKAAVDRRQSLGQILARAGDVGLTAKAVEASGRFDGLLASWRERVRSGRLGGLVRQICRDVDYEKEVAGLYDDPLMAAERYGHALDLDEALLAYALRECAVEDRGVAPARSGAEPARADLPSAKADGETGAGDELDSGLTVPGGRAARWLSEFVQEAMLWGRSEETEKEREKSREVVRIITGHSAKGLEFEEVYIPGVEEGVWPHRNSEAAGTIEEERRLFYVALTRARRRLTLTHCRERVIRGKREPRAGSRFLAEIPEELLVRETAHLSPEQVMEWWNELSPPAGDDTPSADS